MSALPMIPWRPAFCKGSLSADSMSSRSTARSAGTGFTRTSGPG